MVVGEGRGRGGATLIQNTKMCVCQIRGLKMYPIFHHKTYPFLEDPLHTLYPYEVVI